MTAQDTGNGDVIFLVVLLLAAVAWGAAIYLFGVPGIFMPAIILTPVAYLILVLLTFGKS